MDRSGNVFVADADNNNVQKFTNDGTFLTKWGSFGSADGQFNGPATVAVDASGNVFVVDNRNNRVQKFTNIGEFQTAWGSLGSGDGEFNNPSYIAVDPSGNVFVTEFGNNRVQKFTNTGSFLTKWGRSGSGDGEFLGFSPSGVAVDGSGNVFVVDRGNNRVQKFTDTGTFLAKWGSFGSGDGEFNLPLGGAADGMGNVFVADSANRRIQKFDSEGRFLAKWGSSGSGDGEFSSSGDSPNGVAAGFGNVFVVDEGNNRIQKFACPPITEIAVLAVDPASPMTVYAGTVSNGVFKTENGGGSWTEINTGLVGRAFCRRVEDLAIAPRSDPTTPATLYAVAECAAPATLFKTTDGGASWTNLVDIQDCTSVVIDPLDPMTVYAGGRDPFLGAANVVYKTTNGGGFGTWVGPNTPFSGPTALAIDPQSTKCNNDATRSCRSDVDCIPGKCAAMTLYGGSDAVFSHFPVFKTIDGGMNWNATNLEGLFTFPRGLAVSPTSAGTVYVATNGGLFRTTDGGATWSQVLDINGNSIGALALAIDPTTSLTVYAGTLVGVFKTTNGASWSPMSTGIPSDNFIRSLAIDPTTPMRVYAGTGSSGVFKTENGGATWNPVNNGLPPPGGG